jgi:hypothetical protein
MTTTAILFDFFGTCYAALDRAADLDDHKYSMTTIATAYP